MASWLLAPVYDCAVLGTAVEDMPTSVTAVEAPAIAAQSFKTNLFKPPRLIRYCREYPAQPAQSVYHHYPHSSRITRASSGNRKG